MKKLLTILLCLPLLIMAQAPQGFTYQGVATDNNGFELQYQTISIQASILSSSATGTTVWQETHTTTTDTFGLFNVTIGEGTSTNSGSSATFSEIDWGAAAHFMKVEIDVNGASNYVHVGTSQMMSVPYALYAENANNINMDSITGFLTNDSAFMAEVANIGLNSNTTSVGLSEFNNNFDIITTIPNLFDQAPSGIGANYLITSDNSENIYVAGNYNGSRTDIHQLTSSFFNGDSIASTSGTGGASAFVIFKIDSNGVCNASYSIAATNNTDLFFPEMLKIDNNGNIYLLQANTEINTGNSLYLYKFDNQLNLIYKNVICYSVYGSYIDRSLHPMVIDANNNIYFALQFYGDQTLSNGTYVGVQGKWNNAVCKYSNSGSLIWINVVSAQWSLIETTSLSVANNKVNYFLDYTNAIYQLNDSDGSIINSYNENGNVWAYGHSNNATYILYDPPWNSSPTGGDTILGMPLTNFLLNGGDALIKLDQNLNPIYFKGLGNSTALLQNDISDIVELNNGNILVGIKTISNGLLVNNNIYDFDAGPKVFEFDANGDYIDVFTINNHSLLSPNSNSDALRILKTNLHTYLHTTYSGNIVNNGQLEYLNGIILIRLEN